MKDPQPTKEQLMVKIAVKEETIKTLLNCDERIRREFAKSFNWVKNARMDAFNNHIEKEPQLPTWEQIFAQVGKLLYVDEMRKESLNIINLLQNAKGNRAINPENNN